MTQAKKATHAKKKTSKPSRRRKAPTTKRAARPSSQSPPIARSKSTKSAEVLLLLGRKDGATLAELMAATGWQAHSVRGFLSGTVRKRLGLALHSKRSDAGRCYWVESEANAKRAS